MPHRPSLPECEIVELRQYVLHPGQRDVLIELFEREFLETQEAVGMQVLGQFRDLDDANRFVWLRGFHDMAGRLSGLRAFYDGPAWQAHRNAANATMLDSDNVLLLRPAWPGAGLAVQAGQRAQPGATAAPGGVVDLTVFALRAPAGAALLDLCRATLSPVLGRGGARTTAWYVTESTPNDFPRLPLREGEPVLVGVALFDDLATVAAFARSGAWAREAVPELAPWLAGPAECHRLAPTPRSTLHLGPPHPQGPQATAPAQRAGSPK